MTTFWGIDARWFNVAGLVLDIVGATILVWTYASITRRRAVGEFAQMILPGPPGDPRNETLPAVLRARRDARFARLGLVFLLGGFLGQIIGTWPR